MKSLREMRKSERVTLYLGDPIYRKKLNLYAATAMNLLYAIVKLLSGIIYRSDWLAAFGLYFLVLTGLRLSLASYFRLICTPVLQVLERDIFKSMGRQCGIIELQKASNHAGSSYAILLG